KKIKWLFIISLLASCFGSQAQSLDSVKFFAEDKLLEMTLSTDIRNLQTVKKLNAYQPANIDLRFPDSTVIYEGFRLCARGHFRRDYCKIPPILLKFHNPTSPRVNHLVTLILVIGCASSREDAQLTRQ